MLVAGYGMKLFCRYRDAFLFVGGMWDVFEIKGGTRDQSMTIMFLLTRIHHYAKYDWLRQVDGQVIQVTFI